MMNKEIQQCLGLQKLEEGKKSQFSENKQTANSDKRDYGCSKVQSCPTIFPKLGIFSSKFCIFGRQFSNRLKFMAVANCHDTTEKLYIEKISQEPNLLQTMTEKSYISLDTCQMSNDRMQ